MERPGLHPAYPLRTERLELRPHTADDLDDLLLFHSDPEVVRWTPWPVRNRDATREALARKLAQDRLTEEGQWLVLAVADPADDTVVGEGLLKWESAEHRQGEIGFALRRDRWGRGLATEVTRELLRLGFDELGLHRIVGVCAEQNAGSARVLERAGCGGRPGWWSTSSSRAPG